MSDPADKSDDLIAELAKLMAKPGDKGGTVKPVQIPVPLGNGAGGPAAVAPAPSAPAVAAASATPMPVRIPGMEPPIGGRPAAAPIPQPETRAPVTGAIRIPGMDQPAPVSTSAPVGRFDFGKPVAAPQIKQEPLSTLSERLAAIEPKPVTPVPVQRVDQPVPAPQVRIPSDLKPVSENRSFAQGPALVVAPPPPMTPLPQASTSARSGPEQPSSGDFNFDFGFGPNTVKVPVQPSAAAANDPIGDLIAAEMGSNPAPQVPDRPPLSGAGDAADEQAARNAAPEAIAPKPAMAQVVPANARPVTNAAPIPLKPVSVSPRQAESDRFSVAPGATINPASVQPLGAPQTRKPEPVVPAGDSDPMAEIESLIGEAVRVELSAPGPVRVQAPAPTIAKAEIGADGGQHADGAPVVPPLNTQFAPRRSGLRDESGTTSAEDAILAAAAATGTPVGRVEPTTADERPYRRLKVKPARRSFLSGGMRQYIGMAVAGTLLLAAGLGLYWVFNMGRTPDNGATAPQLTADSTPVKVVPDATASTEPDAARSPVLAQMEGASTEPTETLVTTDDTASNTLAVTADTPRDVTATPSDTTESGLANRKVRTVTVRPDGTIVSGDDGVAGTAELPVDRPNVPAVPGDVSEPAGATPLADPIASTIAENSGPQPSSPVDPLVPATNVTEAAIEPVFDPTLVAPKPVTFPVRSEATRALALDSTPTNPVNAVITGAQTPDGQIDLLAIGNEPTPDPTQPAAPADASNAVAYVQLSSSPSESDAQAQVRSLTSRFGSLFGGNALIIQSADLGAKGTWYRVRLPAASLADAGRVCAEIKANGGDCIVSGG